jgi:arginine/ornithine transport system permease protein
MTSADMLEAIRTFSETRSPVDFVLIASYWPIFLQGFINTVSLVVLALIIGAVIALPLAVLRANQTPAAANMIAIYVYVFRGSPLLIQVYLIYYGLSQFEAVRASIFWPILKEAWWCALIAFVLNTTAYLIEIFRGGIEAVSRGEVEAATAIGMSRMMTLRRIVLPSALRRCLPMLGNEAIFMFHGSVVASTITVIDVLGAGRSLNARYYLAYEGFLAATAIYMLIIFGVTRLFGAVERRVSRHLIAPDPVATPH